MKIKQYQNPFPMSDPDRHEIWDMLVKKDIIAFCREDWGMVAGDFIKKNFMGIDARNSPNPDSWRINFPNLKTYRNTWLEQAATFARTKWAGDAEKAIYEATTLRDIEIQGNSAIAHKKFDGYILKKNGESERLNWQSLYRCKKVGSRWKIAGFTGYMPNPM